jgi:transcriptional regulator with PAS, ATPase and Fis domain
MQRVIARARRVAPRSIPVLIEGESGTGKELFSRAIHRASPRRERPFITVNSGAIAPELVESELLGHE